MTSYRGKSLVRVATDWLELWLKENIDVYPRTDNYNWIKSSKGNLRHVVKRQVMDLGVSRANVTASQWILQPWNWCYLFQDYVFLGYADTLKKEVFDPLRFHLRCVHQENQAYLMQRVDEAIKLLKEKPTKVYLPTPWKDYIPPDFDHLVDLVKARESGRVEYAPKDEREGRFVRILL